MEKPKAPWKDFKGNDLYEGMIIRHPSGQEGTIVFHSDRVEPGDQWCVKYTDEDFESRLCLQVGTRGMAIGLALQRDINKCSCGADPQIERMQVMEVDGLGAVWVECPECGQKGTPAILQKEAVWCWNNRIERRKGNNDK